MSYKAPLPTFISVKDFPFNARGDGVTDDTASINAAIAHVNSIIGGTLYFPAGLYNTSSVLTMPKYSTIRGESNGPAAINRTTPGDVITFPTGDVTIAVRDLFLQNSATTNLSNWAASTTYSPGIIVQVPNSNVVLQCTVGGTSGSFRPLGQLSWISQLSTYYTGPAVTISGAPNATYNVLIEILTSGSATTATFKWSTNAGVSWTGPLTAGPSVSLSGTGLSVSFAAGSYVANQFCGSPNFGWSSYYGTTIVDNTVSWTVLDGGAGINVPACHFTYINNVSCFCTTTGIVIDGAEECFIDQAYISNAPAGKGFAGIWICQGSVQSNHTNIAQGSTNIIKISNVVMVGYPIGIIDDGGQGHFIDGFNIETPATCAMSASGFDSLSLSNGDFSDGAGAVNVTAAQYLLPLLQATNTDGYFVGVGSFDQMKVSNVGFGTRTGGINSFEFTTMGDDGGRQMFSIDNCVFGGPGRAFHGVGKIKIFNDLGGNLTAEALQPLIDANPSKSGVFFPSFVANPLPNGTYNLGLGIGTVPVNGLTVNAGMSLLASAVQLVGGADNPDIVIPGNQTTVELSTFASGSGAFSISGFAGGTNGALLDVYNLTGAGMTIKHKALSSSANQIISPTGLDLILPAAPAFGGYTMARFRYSTAQSKWLCTNTLPWIGNAPYIASQNVDFCSAAGGITGNLIITGTNFAIPGSLLSVQLDSSICSVVSNTGTVLTITTPPCIFDPINGLSMPSLLKIETSYGVATAFVWYLPGGYRGAWTAQSATVSAGAVATVPDWSGNGFTLTPTGAYALRATGGGNGGNLPFFQNNGNQSCLSNASVTALSAGCEIIVAARMHSTNRDLCGANGSSLSTNNYFVISIDGSGNVGMTNNTGVSALVNTVAVADGTDFYSDCYFNAASSQQIVNGAAPVTGGNPGTNTATNGFAIAGVFGAQNAGWTGNFYQAFVYPTALSVTGRANFAAYFAAKGI